MWRVAADPRTLGACPEIAGEVQVVDERRVRIAAHLGGTGGPAVAATVAWTELEPPERLTVTVESRIAGTALRLPVRIVLHHAAGGATIVSWSAEVETVGAFAGLAGSLAKREVGRLIDALVACVERGAGGAL